MMSKETKVARVAYSNHQMIVQSLTTLMKQRQIIAKAMMTTTDGKKYKAYEETYDFVNAEIKSLLNL